MSGVWGGSRGAIGVSDTTCPNMFSFPSFILFLFIFSILFLMHCSKEILGWINLMIKQSQDKGGLVVQWSAINSAGELVSFCLIPFYIVFFLSLTLYIFIVAVLSL